MKRKLVIFCTVMLSVLSLSACGKKDTENEIDVLNQKMDALMTVMDSSNHNMSQVDTNLSDMQTKLDEISAYIQQKKEAEEYPAYYDKDDYMGQKIKIIEQYATEIGENGDAFIFITDYHYEKNAGNSVKLISYLTKNIPFLKGRVVFGGDILSIYTPEVAKEVLRNFKNEFEPFEPVYIFGNHDMNTMNTAYTECSLRYEDVYQIIGVENRNRFQAEDGKWYFTIDFPEKQIRYIILDTGTEYSIGPVSGEELEYRHEVDQREWLLNVLKDTPDGWNVGVFAHAIFSGSRSEVTAKANNNLIQLLEAANQHSSYYLDGNEWDFTGKNINVMFVLSGHVHADLADAESVSFPIISTTSDCYVNASTQEKVALGYRSKFAYGTKDEQAFDVVQVDTQNRILYFTRIGYGEDRVFFY